MSEGSPLVLVLCFVPMALVLIHRLWVLVTYAKSRGHFVRWKRSGDGDGGSVRSAVYQFLAANGENYETYGLATSYVSDVLHRPRPVVVRYKKSAPKSSIALTLDRVWVLPVVLLIMGVGVAGALKALPEKYAYLFFVGGFFLMVLLLTSSALKTLLFGKRLKAHFKEWDLSENQHGVVLKKPVFEYAVAGQVYEIKGDETIAGRAPLRLSSIPDPAPLERTVLVSQRYPEAVREPTSKWL
ncbi:MAG: DUF3592 domain-containing protein [Verrucomicrobiota bacterium]